MFGGGGGGAGVDKMQAMGFSGKNRIEFKVRLTEVRVYPGKRREGCLRTPSSDV